MQVVTLYNIDPQEVMDIVRSLRNDGLVQGEDFDFAYLPAKYYDNFSYKPAREKQAQFTFTKDKHATFFTLKYGSKI